MKTMKMKASLLATALLLVSSFALLADRRPHEGKVTDINLDGRMMVVQGETGDQWTLYWTETTKLKGDLAVTDLKQGDSIHFDYVERDGKMFVTELRRTHKADKD